LPARKHSFPAESATGGLVMDDIYSTPTHTPESLRTEPVKPPFGYYGAKQRIARQIIDSLPPHNAWVEGFCGSAALTLAKSPSPIEIINDADGQIVNLFEQLRNNADALCRAIALTPYAREEFENARNIKEDLDPLERARRFLVSTMMTVNGTIGPQRCGFSFSDSYVRSDKEARVSRWYNLPGRLAKVVERLRGVRVENRDACELLNMFVDRPASLVYLDPPYFVKRQFEYVIDANNRDFHIKLLTICKKARCMLLISGYNNDLYTETLTPDEGWTKRTIETHTRDTTGKDYSRTEVLWMNKQFSKAQSSGKIPIRLTSKEKKEKKVNPRRV
jgi:DNA adenine methylase